MYFTLADYKNIEAWLSKRAMKDTQFPNTDNLEKGDLIPVIQDEKNKTISIGSFLRFLNTMTGNHINVSTLFNKSGISLDDAINLVPSNARRAGLVISFLNKEGNWVMYQFNSDDISKWNNTGYWISTNGNISKFKGLFSNGNILMESIVPSPGDYAFVGNSIEESMLYICEEKGEWKNTGTKARQYADMFEAIHSKDFSKLSIDQFIYKYNGEEYQIDEEYADRAEKDALGNIIHFTYATKDGLQNNILEYIYKTLSQVTLPEGSINLEQLSDSLKEYIGSKGQIANLPDEEDITVKDLKLKFKDKKYKPLNFSGKGRKYLRKNMTDGVNILEQYMFDSPNTIYIIQYDYYLNGNTITIPENCVLRFEGGSFNRGSIVLNNTKIEGETYEVDVDIDEAQDKLSHIINNATFSNIELTGTYAVGQQLFHKSLKIPIWWNGTSWITQEWMDINNIINLIDGIENDIVNLNDSINSVEEQANDNKYAIESINNDIVTINESLLEKADRDEVENSITTIQDNLSSLEEQTNENTYSIESINNDIVTLNENIIDVVNNLKTLLEDDPTEAIENFNEIIKFLEGIEDTQSLDSIIASIQTKINQVNNNINNIINGPINDLSDEISNINKSINGLKTSKANKEYVDNALATIEDNISSVEETADNNKYAIEIINNELVGINEDIGNLNTSVDTLNIDVNSKAQDIEKIKEDIVDINTTIEDIAKTVNEDIADSLNTINNQIIESSSSIGDLTENKQNAIINSEDITISEDNKLTLTERAKRKVFIDMWNKACGEYGGYNAETEYFELNGLTDISYEDALKIYSAPRVCAPTITGLSFNNDLRTLIYVPSRVTYISTLWASFRNSDYETLRLPDTTYNTLTDTFYNCAKLRAIYGVLTVKSISNTCFMSLYAMEEITLEGLNVNVWFANSSKLSLASIAYMVSNAANTTAITITVHPNVYAKITGDTTNDAYNDLTDEEKTQWTALVSQAAEKNITFVTV